MNEADLVERAKAGDRDAARGLVCQFYPSRLRAVQGRASEPGVESADVAGADERAVLDGVENGGRTDGEIGLVEHNVTEVGSERAGLFASALVLPAQSRSSQIP